MKNQKGNGRRQRLDLQFVVDSECSWKSALFGVFDSLFLKSGLSLNGMDPKSPSNAMRWNHNLWIIGIAIIRNKADGLNIAAMSCNRRPFEGQFRFVKNWVFPLPTECDVIPQSLSKRFMDEILRNSIFCPLSTDHHIDSAINTQIIGVDPLQRAHSESIQIQKSR